MAKQPADKNKAKTAKVKRPTPLKRDEQSIKRNLRNRAMKSRINTAIRSFDETLKKGDSSATKLTLDTAYSVLDKAVQKGILKKNTGSRTKARLAARLA
jgi:small subunit ribosomal protein S20